MSPLAASRSIDAAGYPAPAAAAAAAGTIGCTPLHMSTYPTLSLLSLPVCSVDAACGILIVVVRQQHQNPISEQSKAATCPGGLRPRAAL